MRAAWAAVGAQTQTPWMRSPPRVHASTASSRLAKAAQPYFLASAAHFAASASTTQATSASSDKC